VSVAVSPQQLVQGLPDWRDARLTELVGGSNNRVWLLEKDGRKAVLKIDAKPRRAPFNSRTEEAAVQSAAAAAGLASPVLFAHEQFYLTEFIDGVGWEPSSLEQEGKIEQLAASLRRIHALPQTGRLFDAMGAAERYASTLRNPDTELIARCVSTIRESQLPNYLCCCHNDLVADNIIETPTLKFIDWEYACDNDPLFDLATVVEHHELDDKHAEALLNTYFEGSGAQWRSRLADQRRVYLALYYLWLASRQHRDEKTLQNLAVRLTTSCSGVPGA
jgi:thiamine kinase-like enzyme